MVTTRWPLGLDVTSHGNVWLAELPLDNATSPRLAGLVAAMQGYMVTFGWPRCRPATLLAPTWPLQTTSTASPSDTTHASSSC